MASLQIPSFPPFNPKGDPNNTGQQWEKWKKSFEYFIIASGINDDNRRKALLLHLVGPATQEIFETLPNTGDTYNEALTAFDNCFLTQKNVPYERSVFHCAKQNY